MYELGGGICLGKPFERVGILGWEAHIQTCKRDEFLFNLKPNQASVVDKSSMIKYCLTLFFTDNDIGDW